MFLKGSQSVRESLQPGAVTCPQDGSAARARAQRKWLAYAVAGLLVLLALKFIPVQEILQQALGWIGKMGPWGPVLFIGIYVVATVFFIPGSVLTIGAGALFGVALGSVCVSLGATLGATAAFLVGRYLARDAVARKVQSNERFAAIDRAVAGEGWKIVLLTRLSPIFPFTLLNYAFGLTRIPLSQYVLASWAGMIPGTVMYVYLGSLVQVGAGHRQRTVGEWVFYAAGLLATLAVTVFITRLARKALAKKIERKGLAPEAEPS